MKAEPPDCAGLQRDELELVLKNRQAELAALHEELRQFSRVISHDLKAPLRAIEGLADMLACDFCGNLPPEPIHHLEIISTSAGRMSNMLDGVSRYWALSEQKLNCQRVDMTALVNELVGKYKVQAPDFEITAGSLPMCWGDVELMRQVWAHLISNAIKFSQKSNLKKILIDGVVDADGSLYTVKDHGVGFDMKYADRLFVLFQRLHSDSEFEGLGIGLAMIRRILRLHGGDINVSSVRGEGTVFTFKLPKTAQKCNSAA